MNKKPYMEITVPGHDNKHGDIIMLSRDVCMIVCGINGDRILLRHPDRIDRLRWWIQRQYALARLQYHTWRVRLENLAWDYLPFPPYLVAGIVALVIVLTFWIFG
jgi:hypothetical protein